LTAAKTNSASSTSRCCPIGAVAGSAARSCGTLLEEAGSGARASAIHVEANNPAMSLYLRLGFRHIDDNGVYHLMEWTASE
jgi:hypothetical protein